MKSEGGEKPKVGSGRPRGHPGRMNYDSELSHGKKRVRAAALVTVAARHNYTFALRISSLIARRRRNHIMPSFQPGVIFIGYGFLEHKDTTNASCQ